MTIQWSELLRAFVGSWAGKTSSPLAGPYSSYIEYIKCRNWFSGSEKALFLPPTGTTPQIRTRKRTLLNRRRQLVSHLFKKGSLTVCLTTDSTRAHRNALSASRVKWLKLTTPKNGSNHLGARFRRTNPTARFKKESLEGISFFFLSTFWRSYS